MNTRNESTDLAAAFSSSPSRRATVLLLLMILTLAAWLRLDGLDKWGLWLDEGYTAWLTERPVSAYAEEMRSDSGPPLFYMLTRPIAMQAQRNVFVLRLLPAVCGILAILMIYMLAVELFNNRWSGLAASTLLAINTHHIMRSQEARNYTLFFLLSLAAMLCLARLTRRPVIDSGLRRFGLWAGTVLSGAAMVYTHNIGWFCLAGLLLFYVIACCIQRKPGRRIGSILSPLGQSAMAGFIIFLLFIPWLPTFLLQSRHIMATNGFWLARPTIMRFLLYMARLVWVPAYGPPGHQVWLISSYILGALTVPALWLAAIMGCIKWIRHGNDPRATILVFCLAGSVFGVAGISLFGPQSVFMEKVVIFMLAGLLLAASSLAPILNGIPAGSGRLRAFRWCAMLLLVTGVSAFVHHGLDFGEEWREATRYAVDQAGPAHDVIVVQDAFSLKTVAWYVHDTAYGPVDWSRQDATVLVHRDDPAHDAPASADSSWQSAIRRLKRLRSPGRKVWAIYRTYDPSSFRQVQEFLASVADEPSPPRNYGVIRVREFIFRR